MAPSRLMGMVALIVSTFAAVARADGERYSVLRPAVHEPMTAWAAKSAGFQNGASMRAMTTTRRSINFDLLKAGVIWNDAPDSGVLRGENDFGKLDNIISYALQTRFSSKPLRGLVPRKDAKVIETIKWGKTTEYVDVSAQPLAQRMHFYDLQICHAKPPCRLVNELPLDGPNLQVRCERVTNGEVALTMIAQAVAWFVRGCVNTHARISMSSVVGTNRLHMNRRLLARIEEIGFETTLKEYERKYGFKFDAPLRRELEASTMSGEFFLGNILHMIEDSYAAGHTSRRASHDGVPQEGDIDYFQDTASQDEGRHKTADKPLCKHEFDRYATCMHQHALEEGLAKARREEMERGPNLGPKSEADLFDSVHESLRTMRDPLLNRISRALCPSDGSSTDPLTMLQRCVKKHTGTDPNPFSEKETLGWRRAVQLMGLEDDAPAQLNMVPSFLNEWAQTPGGRAAGTAARRIAILFRAAAHDKAPSEPDGITSRRVCVRGAAALDNYLKYDVLRLTSSMSFAGGSTESFRRDKCPAISAVVNNFDRYSDFDRSLETRTTRFIKDKFTDATAMVAKMSMGGAFGAAMSAASKADRRFPFLHAELTCDVRCRTKPFQDGHRRTARYGNACLVRQSWLDTDTDEDPKWDLACCSDLSVNNPNGKFTPMRPLAEMDYDKEEKEAEKVGREEVHDIVRGGQ